MARRTRASRLERAAAACLEPGVRLRLDVSSSDFPQWDRNLNTCGPLYVEPASAAVVATQAVYHDSTRPSRLLLPVERSST